MATTPFVLVPELTAITIAYRNSAYIADRLCPRAPVNDEEFRYTEYPKEESYSILDTRVGRLSQPNTITVGGSEKLGRTQDYGLDGPIPQKDLERDQGRHSIQGRLVERMTNILLLDREQRVAKLYADPKNYAPNLILTLSGSSRFSDPGSDPLGMLLEAMDKPLLRPNSVAMGHDVWSKLRRHPRLVKAVRNDSGEGAITLAQLTELLEVDRILIGASRINSARLGQEMRLERVWGSSIALTYQDPAADFQTGGISFALTAQWGERIAGEYEVPAMGLRGGTVVRVGEAVGEIALAPYAGFLIQNGI